MYKCSIGTNTNHTNNSWQNVILDMISNDQAFYILKSRQAGEQSLSCQHKALIFSSKFYRDMSENEQFHTSNIHLLCVYTKNI